MSGQRRMLYVALLAGLAHLPAATRAQGVEPFDAAAAPGLPATVSPAFDLAGAIALTAGAGQLGQQALYSLGLAFHPHRRLGLEATLAHNPARGVHAALHHFGAVLPIGTLWRVRPFVVAGLGTMQVFPGQAIQADTVTRLALNGGAGTHFFVRDDVALRIEARSFALLDQQEEARGTLQFTQWSAGVTFYRSFVAAESQDRGVTP